MARLSLVWGVLVTAAMGALAWQAPPVVEALRDRVFDSYQRVMPVETPTEATVAVVDIDAEALARLGPWPWPRSYMAELVDRLFEHGAVAVGIDLDFTAPDPISLERILDSWSRFSTSVPPSLPDFGLRPNDTVFAEAIRGRPVVLRLRPADPALRRHETAEVRVLGAMPHALPEIRGIAFPISILASTAGGQGIGGLTPDNDGVVRRATLVARSDDTLVPGFAAELLRVVNGAQNYALRMDAGGELGLINRGRPWQLWIGGRSVPVARDASVRLLPAPDRADRAIGAMSILGARPRDAQITAQLTGRVVLLGSTAPGLVRMVTTPAAEQRPELLVQADLLEQILAGRSLSRPVWVEEAELAAILGLGLILSLLVGIGRVGGALAVMLVGGGAALLGGVTGYARAGLLVDPALPVLTLILVCLPGILIRSQVRRRTRRMVAAQFTQPLPPAILDAVAAAPRAALTPRGAAREVTAMAIDLPGLAHRAAALPPEAALGTLARARAAIAETVGAHGGIFEATGDETGMAIWNAPLARDDHAGAALAAIPDLEAVVASALATGPSAALAPVRVALGIYGASAIIGSSGTRGTRRYCVIGPAKDLAAHLQLLTPSYGVSNCVGAATAIHCPAHLIAVELDRVVLRQDSEAEPVFTVLDRAHPGAERLARLLGEARAAFLDRDWPGAEAAFTSLAALDLEPGDMMQLARVYLDRIEAFQHTPPTVEWDGSALG